MTLVALLWVSSRPDQASVAALVLIATTMAAAGWRGWPRLAMPLCGACRHRRPPRSTTGSPALDPCAECGAPADQTWHGVPRRSRSLLVGAVLLLVVAVPAGSAVARLRVGARTQSAFNPRISDVSTAFTGGAEGAARLERLEWLMKYGVMGTGDTPTREAIIAELTRLCAERGLLRQGETPLHSAKSEKSAGDGFESVRIGKRNRERAVMRLVMLAWPLDGSAASMDRLKALLDAVVPHQEFSCRTRQEAGDRMAIRVDDDGYSAGLSQRITRRVVTVRIDGLVMAKESAEWLRGSGSFLVPVPANTGSLVLEIEWEQTFGNAGADSSDDPASSMWRRAGVWRREIEVVASGEPTIELVDHPSRSPWPDGKANVIWLQLTDIGAGQPDSRQLVTLHAPPRRLESQGLDGNWFIRQGGGESRLGRWIYDSSQIIDRRIDPGQPFELVFRPTFEPKFRWNRRQAAFAECWWNGIVVIPFAPGELEPHTDADDPTWIWRQKGWEKEL